MAVKKRVRYFNTKVLLACLAGVFGLFFILILVISHYKNFGADEYYKKYSVSKVSIAKNITDNLSEIVDNIGVDGVVKIVIRSQKENGLSSSNCHAIMHLLGHQAYSRKLPNLPILVGMYGNMCEAGFLHGIEAQITLQETDTKLRIEKLKDLCSLFKSNFNNTACFHGVGHVYYQQLRDPLKALRACDLLHDEDIDLNPCYRGVFNELSNDIQGIDGETGLPVANDPKKIENQNDPITYCNSFDEKYRVHCYSSIPRLTNTAIPLPEFVKNLPLSEQGIINTRLPKVPVDEAKAHEKLAKELAVDSDYLDLADCKPVKPLVMKVISGDKILIKNTATKLHTIVLNKDTSYAVKAHESLWLNYDFGNGGLYGYGCDYTPYAVGYFLVEKNIPINK